MTWLARAQANQAGAWDEFVSLYQPLIYRWCRKGLEPSDAEDVVQEVLLSVFRKLGAFEHNGRTGAFRAWLRVITSRLVIDRYREAGDEPDPVGGTTAHQKLQDLYSAEPTEQELSEDLALLYHRAWELVRNEFTDRDNQIFRRVLENEEAPRDVAADMGTTANVVSIVVSRIKKRVRERFGDVIQY